MSEIKFIKVKELYEFAEQNKLKNICQLMNYLQKNNYIIDIGRRLVKPYKAGQIYSLLKRYDSRWFNTTVKEQRNEKTNIILNQIDLEIFIRKIVKDEMEKIQLEKNRIPPLIQPVLSAEKILEIQQKRTWCFCPTCSAGFDKPGKLKMHIKMKHEGKNFWDKLTPEQKQLHIRKMWYGRKASKKW